MSGKYQRYKIQPRVYERLLTLRNEQVEGEVGGGMG